LPSATLGKAFAECFYGFAECFGHSAKRSFPVVNTNYKVRNIQTSNNFKPKYKLTWNPKQQYKLQGLYITIGLVFCWREFGRWPLASVVPMMLSVGLRVAVLPSWCIVPSARGTGLLTSSL
jgi:hypothetical protein